MKKNCEKEIDQFRFIFKKAFLAMKLTAIIFLISTFSLLAVETYSQNTRISLNLKNVQIKEVLQKIESNTEYFFIYNNQFVDVDKAVSVVAENKKVIDVLTSLFQDQQVEFQVSDRKIVIVPLYMDNGQQQITVSGKVTDSAGGSLPGVSIVVKSTTNGTITDANGSYSLSNVTENGTLQFSFIGMKMQEVAVGSKTTINVTLEEETVGIEEVVAIGYGVSKKSDITGSIGSVSSKSFENQPITTLTSALQGRAAGVSISNVSGAPGGDIRIRIRGANSITGGNDPLYVVDGMQLSSFNLNDLNPSDIENFEILKDASATAIYGSRGANGVVLVTTKKGRSEKARIDFTANYGISNVANKYNLLDPVAFANQYNQVHPNGYSAAEITKFQNGFGTDWQDEVFQTGKTQDYQLSVSGSSPKTSYLLSGRYLDQTGIVINSDYKRYSFHSNIETKVTDKVTLSAAVYLNRGQGLNNQVVGSLRGESNKPFSGVPPHRFIYKQQKVVIVKFITFLTHVELQVKTLLPI